MFTKDDKLSERNKKIWENQFCVGNWEIINNKILMVRENTWIEHHNISHGLHFRIVIKCNLDILNGSIDRIYEIGPNFIKAYISNIYRWMYISEY